MFTLRPSAEELSHSTRWNSREKNEKTKQQRETSLFLYNIDFRFTLSHVSVRFLLFRARTHTHSLSAQSQQHLVAHNATTCPEFNPNFFSHPLCVRALWQSPVATPYSDFYLFWIFQLIFFCHRSPLRHTLAVIGDVWRYYYKSRKQSAGHLSFTFFFLICCWNTACKWNWASKKKSFLDQELITRNSNSFKFAFN